MNSPTDTLADLRRTDVVVRTEVLLHADAARVVARLFLPGQEVILEGASRAGSVISRVLAVSERQAQEVLRDVTSRFAHRHRDLNSILDENFAALAHRVPNAEALSPARRRLVGAYFTQEYALEAAALLNPSLVIHPEQGPDPSRVRLVMSARAIGEGHISSLVFRTGELQSPVSAPHDSRRTTVVIDPASPIATAGRQRPGDLDREHLRREAALLGADPESLDVVLSALPETFSPETLEGAVQGLLEQRLTRVHADETAACVQTAAMTSYVVTFPAETKIPERTLMPAVQAESHGIEDARFVRFTNDDGVSTYLATYTAFDGAHVTPRQLQTDDFRTFRATAYTGPAAANKGMALFPRKVGGRYLALSRWDRENNALAESHDGHHWHSARSLQSPRRPWELIQLGNCGSPMETEAGWLVLTHGVGPMRNYAMGALLLDLTDPTRVIGRLRDPLMSPSEDERNGYVPNVVYSCGGLIHGETLVLPYGCSDASIRLALIDVPALLDHLGHPGRRARRLPSAKSPVPTLPSGLRPTLAGADPVVVGD